MASLNQVNLIGNLTRDVEMKYTPSGMGVAKVGLAINRKYRNSKTNELCEEVTFVDITFFGKTAEIASQYLAKGSSIFVEGRLKLDTWQDKQTGQNRSKLHVVGENMQFLSKKPDGARPAQQQRPAQPPEQDQPSFDVDIQEESVPF